MIFEGPIWLENSDKYFVLHYDGSLQLRHELANESTILIDSCNYFYDRDQLVKICLKHIPNMTMIEFGHVQKSLDYQANALREGVPNVRLC